jgi:two-component system sensor histidine kinase QseC
MRGYSIRFRLLLLLLGSLVLAWVVILGAGYQKAREEIHELADARLQQGAHTLLMLDLKRLARLAMTSEASETKVSDDEDQGMEAPPLAFQVWSDDGKLILESAGAPAAPYVSSKGFATRTIDQLQWRSYTVHDRKRAYQVTALEPLAVRDHPVVELTRRMSQVLVLALPLLGLLVWFSIQRGLQPLRRLSEAISSRDASNLDSLQLQQVPDEVRPLITALNSLLQRLARSLDKERAFTADAAHELRTPLAAIKVQAEVALLAGDGASRRQAIEQVISGVNRTTHLVQQLLLLARVEHVGLDTPQAVDLGRMATDCVARYADEAGRRGIECDLETEAGCVLQGDAAMLTVLLDNLLDNAIKYGRAGGHIFIGVGRRASALWLRVEDDGEGVSEADRARLHDRFFRVEGHVTPGSGLGLSIVEKIAMAHGGVVEIGAGRSGRGFGVNVVFPT